MAKSLPASARPAPPGGREAAISAGAGRQGSRRAARGPRLSQWPRPHSMTQPDPHHRREPDFLQNLRAEFSGWRTWVDRVIVLAYALASGLFVVGFTLAADRAFSLFQRLYHWNAWAVLLWMPALTVLLVWATHRWFPGASGSGIPQIKAALHPALPPEKVGAFASLRLTFAKIVLGVGGFAAGLSIGREGPSVQVAAGVMQHARRWLSPGSTIDARALLVAGGAAGIAAAFNAPLAGVVFAIEELAGRLEARSSGLIITAIVLAGMVSVSVFGNVSYFGVIRVPDLNWDLLWPGLLVAVVGGAAGGLFSRLLAMSLTGAPERLNAWRARWPLKFAAAGGLLVAVIGLASEGQTFGAGSEAVKRMLAGEMEQTGLYALLKAAATWITAWCGVPGGIFAPSLSVGAGIGHSLAAVIDPTLAPALIAMGMAAFLAAVTQAPLTAFLIVMEMVDGHSMVLSLMASAMLASLVSRMISRPLYEALADHMVARIAAAPPEKTAENAPKR